MEVPRIPEVKLPDLATAFTLGKLVVGRLFKPGGWDFSKLIYSDATHEATLEHLNNIVKGEE